MCLLTAQLLTGVLCVIQSVTGVHSTPTTQYYPMLLRTVIVLIVCQGLLDRLTPWTSDWVHDGDWVTGP